ncbi:mtDNA inheritance protein Dml1 [Mycena floridula]|nr:mtDNA inheritance protein Dml1 [Mycena floridula]
MKEILYVQAGSWANFVGTHFWNTQESYFTYEETEEVLLWHDRSFREGLDRQGKETYCPRLLAFDRKANFGALSRDNETSGEKDSHLWAGKIIEIKQNPITSVEETSGNSSKGSAEIRYWSDFNRVEYAPKTLRSLPDVAEWEDVQGNWMSGQETFKRYNEETLLMEGPVRSFLEECDSPQGIQVMNDASDYAGFTHSFLTHFRDELLKTPSIVFPILSGVKPGQTRQEGQIRAHNRIVVNDALYLRNLREVSALTIPLQSPTTWTEHWWSGSFIKPNLGSIFDMSAVLSSHFESSTLPLRLKSSNLDIGDLSASLNCRGHNPFALLCGVFPTSGSLSADLRRGLFNFSTSTPQIIKELPSDNFQFACHNVTRGFSDQQISAYVDWLDKSYDPRSARTTHTFGYPASPPFPDILSGNHAITSRNSLELFSTLSVDSSNATMFSDYAVFLGKYIEQQGSGGLSARQDEDLGIGEMKELVNDLWTIHDNYTIGD